MAAAGALGCLVGVRAANGVLAAGPQGVVQHLPGPTAGHRSLPDGTDVWLDPGPGAQVGAASPGPPDEGPNTLETVLRRLAVAVRVSMLQGGSSGRAADLRLVTDPGAMVEDRAPALRRLGFTEGSRVLVLALAGPDEAVERMVADLRRQSALLLQRPDGRVRAVFVREPPEVSRLVVPVGVRGAFSGAQPVLEAPAAWRRTRTALRFARPSAREGPAQDGDAVLVDATRVGAYAVLAEHLDAQHIRQVHDVQQLAELERESGAEMLDTLLAVASTDSLRQAARRLHVHHNSVIHRVRRAERVLGFSCTEPYGRARLFLTLTLHRIQGSWQHF